MAGRRFIVCRMSGPSACDPGRQLLVQLNKTHFRQAAGGFRTQAVRRQPVTAGDLGEDDMTIASSAFSPTETGKAAALLSKAVAVLMGRLGRPSMMPGNRSKARFIGQLHELNDHMLRDIDLHRGDIEFAVRTGTRPDR
jgi:uncharacterized protein YjiS (DUF1127 family)